MSDKINEFRTKDMYSAAVLRSLSYPLINLDRSEGNYSIFVFNDKGLTAQETLQKHWNGQLEVNSRNFVESVRELKTRLHGQNYFPG
jgi:hypothetical protein